MTTHATVTAIVQRVVDALLAHAELWERLKRDYPDLSPGDADARLAAAQQKVEDEFRNARVWAALEAKRRVRDV